MLKTIHTFTKQIPFSHKLIDSLVPCGHIDITMNYLNEKKCSSGKLIYTLPVESKYVTLFYAPKVISKKRFA